MTPTLLRTLPDSTLATILRNTSDGNIRRIIGIRRHPHPRRSFAEQWASQRTQPWTPSQFAAVAEVSRQTATEWLAEMVEAGEVVRVGHGLYETTPRSSAA